MATAETPLSYHRAATLGYVAAFFVALGAIKDLFVDREPLFGLIAAAAAAIFFAVTREADRRAAVTARR